VNRIFSICLTILVIGSYNSFAQFTSLPNLQMNNSIYQAQPNQNIVNQNQNFSQAQRQTTQPLAAVSLNDTSKTKKNQSKSNLSFTSAVTKTDSLEDQIFGKSFFKGKNLFFEPNLKIATPQNYIIGPDDQLIIDIYGYSEDHYSLTVSSDGSVKIPKIGIIQLGGLSIQEAKKKIVNRLSRIFVGLKTEGNGVSATNLYATITLGNIRQINVLVQGEVENPGSYSVPSLAKAINVLYLAGGPTVNGTFRSIELIRNNKVIGKIDLYDYLIGGILKNDFTLQDRDIIKVGLYENRITLLGKVKRPLIFEFLSNENIEQIIQNFGGGFTEDAYKQNIKLTRFTTKERKLLDINYELASSVFAKSGDIINVEGINSNRFENRVKIIGEVWRPGDYSLENCPTILKLIENAGSFKENAFTNRILIKRLRNDNIYENIAFNYLDILNKKSPDIVLKREDEIFVQAIDHLREEFTVTIHGEVNFKPENESSRLGTSVDENIRNNKKVETESDQSTIIKENEIEEELKSNEANNKLLNRQSKLTLPYIADMTVEDLIIKAGGLRESANSGLVEIVRRNKVGLTQNSVSDATNSKIGEIYKFSINNDLSINQNASKFKLEPFDEIFIRSSSNYQIQQFVTIKGEIKFPGVYGMETKNERISNIVERAGNLTFTANLDGASLLRKRKKSDLDNLIRQDQIKELRNNYNGIEVTDNENNSGYEKIGIDLKKIFLNPLSNDDLIVEDGDIIDIPILKQTVKVSGEVIHPTTVTYSDGLNLKDYINRSGGYTQKSARKKGYVIYANGSINRTRNFLFFKNYPKISPGSEIVIPSFNKNTQPMSSVIGMYTGTITSLISVYLLLKATLN